jgi:hypothetical protein
MHSHSRGKARSQGRAFPCDLRLSRWTALQAASRPRCASCRRLPPHRASCRRLLLTSSLRLMPAPPPPSSLRLAPAPPPDCPSCRRLLPHLAPCRRLLPHLAPCRRLLLTTGGGVTLCVMRRHPIKFVCPDHSAHILSGPFLSGPAGGGRHSLLRPLSCLQHATSRFLETLCSATSRFLETLCSTTSRFLETLSAPPPPRLQEQPLLPCERLSPLCCFLHRRIWSSQQRGRARACVEDQRRRHSRVAGEGDASFLGWRGRATLPPSLSARASGQPLEGWPARTRRNTAETSGGGGVSHSSRRESMDRLEPQCERCYLINYKSLRIDGVAA